MSSTDVILTIILVVLIAHAVILVLIFGDMEKFASERHADLMRKLDELRDALAARR